MKKKILLLAGLAIMLVCLLAVSVSADQVDPNADYYDKVYVATDGTALPLYEKVDDTYYPLVWFAYDIMEEDGTTIKETKYVKVHFEDVETETRAYSQGRFNGITYSYTDENGQVIPFTTANVVLLNLRDGHLKSYSNGAWNGGTTPIKTIETGFHTYSRIEAIYLPLTMTQVHQLNKPTLRVCDIDRNHSIEISFNHACLQNSKIEEIFIPGTAHFGHGAGGTNSHFKFCSNLKRVEFGEGFHDWFPGYLFDSCSSLEEIIIPKSMIIGWETQSTSMLTNAFAGCKNLKRVYFMGSQETLQDVISSATVGGNGDFINKTQISYADYSKLEDKSGSYIIYDCSPCLAYNKDVHTPSDNITIVGGDFFAEMTVACPCGVEGCSATSVVGTIAPVFEWVGYSRSEFADANGSYAVTQGFKVNRAAAEEYLSYQADFSFGIVAAVGVDAPLSLVDGKVVAENGALTAPVSKLVNDKLTFVYDYFDIKVVGIPGEGTEKGDQRGTAIVFNAYVVANGQIKYLHAGKTYDTAQGTSYNNAK